MTPPGQSNPPPIPTHQCDEEGVPGDKPLDALDLSATDYGVLMAARYFFSSFVDPSKAAWLSVMLGSDDFFPEHRDSLRVVQSVLAVVHEIRSSRSSALRFSNPHCLDCAHIVTGEERHMMAMMRDIRSGTHSGAVTHAMLLCEGNAVDGLLYAGEVLTLHLADTLDV